MVVVLSLISIWAYCGQNICGEDGLHCISIVCQEASCLAQTAEEYNFMHPMLDQVSCVLASTAPVEYVFSHGRIIMSSYLARLGYDRLSARICSV
jgi:hypothetical protein